ncbi:MAG: hypothetical protein HN348_27905, partial [Proteobacteria bacterium]|nr:hypothetical protein [Pseudomonadota bacterium]
IFYLDYLDSNMDEGYWDDRDEEPADHLDGDYLKPTENLGIVAFGANYGYEVHIVRTDITNGYFGLSFLVGGGLGLGVMVGGIDRWGPDANGNPSYKLYLEGEPAEGDKGIPPVYPMVDINAGLRFNFGDRAVFRLEGGLHTLVYWGGTLGIMF